MLLFRYGLHHYYPPRFWADQREEWGLQPVPLYAGGVRAEMKKPARGGLRQREFYSSVRLATLNHYAKDKRLSEWFAWIVRVRRLQV